MLGTFTSSRAGILVVLAGLIAAGSSAALSACSSAPSESVGTARQPDTIVTTQKSVAFGSETSVAWIPNAAAGPTVLLGYNDGTGNGSGVMGWAVSTDNGQTFLTTGVEQNNAAGYSSFFSSSPTNLHDGSPYKNTLGDPVVVQTGYAGIAAYLVLAQSTTSGTTLPEDVVMFTSTDGGRTWGPANGGSYRVISTLQSSASDSNVTNGYVDQPVAYYEGGQTHVIWTNWNNKNSVFNDGGPRNWVEKVHIGSDGSITTSTPQEVRIDCGLSCVKFTQANLAAYCSTPSQDGCNNGTETLMMGFPRVNNGASACSYQNTSLNCNQTVTSCTSTLDVQFRLATSVDGGQTWTQGVGNSDGSISVMEDTQWPNCIMPSAVHLRGSDAGTNTGGNNRGKMALAHDDALGEWHVLINAGSHAGADGGDSGQRIYHVWDSSDDLSGITGSFSTHSAEACRVTMTPGSSYMQYCSDTDHSAECFLNQWAPELAVAQLADGGSQVAAAWHDSRLGDAGDGTEAFFGSAALNGAGSSWPTNGACRLLSQPYSPAVLLTNGDFETGGFSSWSTSGPAVSVSTSTVHAGTYAAMLGSTSPTNGESTITQSVTIPTYSTTGPAGAALGMYYWETCPDSCGINCDFFRVEIRDTSNNVLTTPLPKECTSTGGWAHLSADLSAYAGQTVVVAITSKDDNWPGDATYAFVDDVSVLQNQAAVPWKDPATVNSGNLTPWGDYEGMAAAQDGTGAFIPAWGDNRNDPPDGGAGRTQVFATQWVLP